MFASLTTFCRRVYALSFEWCSGPHDKARSRQKLLDLIINSQKDYWYNNVCFGLSSTFNTLISKWDFFLFFYFGPHLSLLEKKVEGARHEAFDDRIINLKHALSASELSIILSLTGLKPFDIYLFYFVLFLF